MPHRLRRLSMKTDGSRRGCTGHRTLEQVAIVAWMIERLNAIGEIGVDVTDSLGGTAVERTRSEEHGSRRARGHVQRRLTAVQQPAQYRAELHSRARGCSAT